MKVRPIRDLPHFRDLRAFVRHLDENKLLARVTERVSTVHEMTEIHRRVLACGGPALLFELAGRSDGSTAEMRVLVNLFGTVERVAWGLGVGRRRLGELGELLAALRELEPIDDLRGALQRWPLLKAAFATIPVNVTRPPVQQIVHIGAQVDLGRLPIQACWPGEPAPLITWPLVITRSPGQDRTLDYNMGVYRMQVLGPNRAIVRWLSHRGGAAHHRLWAAEGREGWSTRARFTRRPRRRRERHRCRRLRAARAPGTPGSLWHR